MCIVGLWVCGFVGFLFFGEKQPEYFKGSQNKISEGNQKILGGLKTRKNPSVAGFEPANNCFEDRRNNHYTTHLCFAAFIKPNLPVGQRTKRGRGKGGKLSQIV